MQVASLDEDRILRRFRNVVQAAVRTNFFQRDAAGAPRATIAFKFESQRIEELPQPCPLYEISVYAPRVEGVHLRFGKVARGGLRWSDRPQDFRTEVLGLVKAQQVKNALIVPVGAKGGFVPKLLPAASDRDAWMEEGIAAYRLFVTALLELTDNLAGESIVPPATPSAMTAMISISSSRRTRERQRFPTSPTLSQSIAPIGWATPSHRAGRPVTTTRR